MHQGHLLQLVQPLRFGGDSLYAHKRRQFDCFVNVQDLFQLFERLLLIVNFSSNLFIPESKVQIEGGMSMQYICFIYDLNITDTVQNCDL